MDAAEKATRKAENHLSRCFSTPELNLKNLRLGLSDITVVAPVSRLTGDKAADNRLCPIATRQLGQVGGQLSFALMCIKWPEA